MLPLLQGPLASIKTSDLERMIASETEITIFVFDVVSSSITESSRTEEGRRARRIRVEKCEEAEKKYGGIRLLPECVWHSYFLSLSSSEKQLK